MKIIYLFFNTYFKKDKFSNSPAILFFVLYWSQTANLISSYFIHHEAGVYKATITQHPPFHLKNYSTSNSAGLEFPTNLYIHALIQKEGEYSNPRPLGRESPALTTAPRLSS